MAPVLIYYFVELQGKYSFPSNNGVKQSEEQSYVKRLAIKDKNRKSGEYLFTPLVFKTPYIIYISCLRN